MVSYLKTHCIRAFIALVASTAVAESWSERLGYPPNAKVVVLHAHDLGLCFESNQAIAELADAGVLRSASALAPAPWFADAVEWAKSHPQLDIGLQLALNSEHPRYRWRPVAADSLTTSLVDADGALWRNVIQVMVSAEAEQVESELRMQLLRAERMGLRPTHLTTHLGALLMREDLTQLYLRIAREQWTPAVVVELTPEMAVEFRQDGFPVPDSLVETLAAYPLPMVNQLQILRPSKSLEEKTELLLEVLNQLSSGVTQIAFRPAIDSPALRALDEDWQQRVWERMVWDNPQVRAALKAEGVVLTDWIEIMSRFEGRHGR